MDLARCARMRTSFPVKLGLRRLQMSGSYSFLKEGIGFLASISYFGRKGICLREGFFLGDAGTGSMAVRKASIICMIFYFSSIFNLFARETIELCSAASQGKQEQA